MPCTLAPDGSCIAPKIPSELDPLFGLSLVSYVGYFTISWDTNISYPDQSIRILYRERGGSDYFPMLHVSRDSGTAISVLTLTPNSTYDVWLRVEDDTGAAEFIHTSVQLSYPSLDFGIVSNSFNIGVF